MKKKKIKLVKSKKPNKSKRYFIDGVECEIAFENIGIKFLVPTFDDPDDKTIARHIVYARITESGEVKLY